jgi:hypothetical protein
MLGIWLFVLGGKSRLASEPKAPQEAQNQNQEKQQKLQVQKAAVDRGTTISEQVGPALLRDMATLSLKNEKLKNLLAKNGYNVEVKPEATPAPKP